jgi:hypothetical protein
MHTDLHKQPEGLEVQLPYKTGRTGSAAAKCSNQADLHLTFIDPI